MASWTGTQPYATKKQLVSSITGLYDDLQDFQFSTITSVSTLTVKNWISVPVLYVSTIVGANVDISGITINKDGILDAPVISLSSLSLKGFDSLLDLDVSFDLGLGKALGGLLGGLGALLGGAAIGVGTGAGLAIKGAEQGIATLIAGRPQNFINSNVFETINFTTQLQISTLGNAYPLYSSIIRTVSSSSANEVPGPEIFLSTFITPGTTCIRSVSDPFNLITGDSNLNTSTLQGFGQWVALPEGAQTDVDVVARDGFFSTITINYDGQVDLPFSITNSNTILPNIDSHIYTYPYTASIQKPYVLGNYPFEDLTVFRNSMWSNITWSEYTLNFISTPYVQFQSTITTSGLLFIQPSIISTPSQLIYSNAGNQGNFAFCEPDETGFTSTGTFDLIAQGQDLFIQWGLAVDNLNSTIAAGTAKRVSWDIPGAYSNFVEIPVPQSTIVTANLNNSVYIETSPYEARLLVTNNNSFFNSGLYINASTMMVGVGNINTSASNQPGYAYQFNGNTYIQGKLEAETLIALSSIFATSTFVDTQVSTASIIADLADITELVNKQAYFSTLYAEGNITNQYINSMGMHRFMGFQTPISIVSGTPCNLWDQASRFDFVNDQTPQAFYIISRPNNNTIASFFSTQIEIPNLTVNNLTASNLIYGKAEAPTIETSTITFGWTGDFNSPVPVQPSLQQTLETEPGLAWTNYNAAKYQMLNIMAFSNIVNMQAQQFSTPIEYINTQYSGDNREGWASTIFYNALTTPCRIFLAPNAGVGEVSFQSQTSAAVVFPNQSQAQQAPVNAITVPIGSTYKFTSDGSNWTTLSNAPTPGTIQYTNALNITMDFENLNISTTDTLNINAETINLNGQVVMPNAQLSNLYLDGFLSSLTVNANTFTAGAFPTSVNNSFSQPFAMLNTTTTTDGLINIRNTVIPSRGFNLFNSYNLAEWNNTLYNIDTTTAAGRPTMIVGEVVVTTPPFTPYSGQFWVNNAIDSPALVIPIYINNEGVLTQLGSVVGGSYARIFTANGSTWSMQSNVSNPQGSVNATYSNYYTVAMNSALTTINAGMPLVYNTPSLLYNTNKTFFYSPQIRVATIDAPSFNTREAGMEAPFYYDSNIIFSRIVGTEWESAAFNPILGIYGNTYYSIAGWQCFACMTRFRGDGDTLVLAWDIDATAYPVGGGATDYIWGSARYIQVRHQSLPNGNIRENYLMIPKNYFNFAWQGQGPLN